MKDIENIGRELSRNGKSAKPLKIVYLTAKKASARWTLPIRDWYRQSTN